MHRSALAHGVIRILLGTLSRTAGFCLEHLHHHFIELVLQAIRLLIQQELNLQVSNLILQLGYGLSIDGLIILNWLSMASYPFACVVIGLAVAKKQTSLDISLKHFETVRLVAISFHRRGID